MSFTVANTSSGGLAALTQKPTASLVTITGRRRNGKSRLVKPRHTSIFPVLVHVNGVSPKVLESGFFTHVVDFGAVSPPRGGPTSGIC